MLLVCPTCKAKLLSADMRKHVVSGPIKCRLAHAGGSGYTCVCGRDHMTSSDLERHLETEDLEVHAAEKRLIESAFPATVMISFKMEPDWGEFAKARRGES